MTPNEGAVLLGLQATEASMVTVYEARPSIR